MRFVEAIWSVVSLFVVKHNGFERSNAPMPHVAQIPPGTPNGPQMLHISMTPIDPYCEYSIYFEYTILHMSRMLHILRILQILRILRM